MDEYTYNSYQDNVMKYIQQQRWDKVLEYNNMLDEVDYMDPDHWNVKGSALAWLGDFKEAMVYFDRALSLDPMSSLAWFGKANALFNLGSFKMAIKCCDKTLEIFPTHIGALQTKGFSLYHIGQFKEAIDSFDEALELNPIYEVKNVLKEWKITAMNALENEFSFNNESNINTEDVGRLIKALKDKNVVIRRKAVKALGKHNNRKAVDALEDTLNDDDFYVRKYVKEALDHIKIDCPQCDFVNESNALICSKCGYNLEIIEEIDNNTSEIKEIDTKCPNCGFENLENAKFCSGCGNKLESDISENIPNLLDVNSASEDKIASLNGVGPILAKKAIQIRESKGEFESVEDFCISLELKPHIAKNIESLIICTAVEKTKKLRGNEPSRRIVDF